MANENKSNIGNWKNTLSPWLKVVWSVMRIVLVPALCLIALYVGLTIGYSYIGGQDASDILKFETWKHLYDLVFAEG